MKPLIWVDGCAFADDFGWSFHVFHHDSRRQWCAMINGIPHSGGRTFHATEDAAVKRVNDLYEARILTAIEPQILKDATPGTADAYLTALLHYTGAFYEAAISSGMKASVAADAVKHVESAARGLCALARSVNCDSSTEQTKQETATRGELYRAAIWMEQQSAKEQREGKAELAGNLEAAAQYTIEVGYEGESR